MSPPPSARSSRSTRACWIPGTSNPGPADGPAVMLLHGWPYDVHSFADVTPVLASAGYRVIVPFVRGYGTTRFLSATHPATASKRLWRWMPSP